MIVQAFASLAHSIWIHVHVAHMMQLSVVARQTHRNAAIKLQYSGNFEGEHFWSFMAILESFLHKFLISCHPQKFSPQSFPLKSWEWTWRLDQANILLQHKSRGH